MATLTLEAIKEDFAQWRASRTKIGKIPEYLWAKVLKILEDYPIGEVSKELHLSGGQVVAKRRQNNDNVLAMSNFVERSLAPVVSRDNISVEIKRPDGTTLKIESVSEPSMLQVLSHFMQVVQ